MKWHRWSSLYSFVEKRIKNSLNKICKKEILFLSISWIDPKTDGLQMECVLDDGMKFVEHLILVFQTVQFGSESYVSSYFLV